jgi:predicted acyl esterase
MDVYLPDKPGKYPVILAMCPYKKEAQAGPPREGFHSEGGNYRFFVPHGYAMVFATVRGAGWSQGKFELWGPQEQKDSYDIVEGIAKQPWCDGNIGMLGGSYLGLSQYYTAAQQPPHLKCITPCDAGIDVYRDFVYQSGGMFYNAFMGNWSTNLVLECMFPGPIEGKEPPPNFMCDWESNYLDGQYYHDRSMKWVLDKIKVPVLGIASGSGWLHSRGMIRGLPMIKSKNLKAVIGPTAYLGAVSMFSTLYWHNEKVAKYVLRWFDYWLKGINTGIMDEPPVVVYDGGTGDWRYENELPPFARTQWKDFYLHANPAHPAEPPQGLISMDKPTGNEEPEKIKTPRARPDLAKPGLAYVTPALEKEVRIWGPVSATIYGKSDTTNTAPWGYFIKIGDQAPDGKVTLISKGSLKASMREVDESKSEPGRPWHPFTKKVILEPNKVYDFQIEMLPVFHTFKAGHKIWVQIACDDPDFMLINYTDTVAGSVPAENYVYHDQEHPTHIFLPIIPDAPIIAPVKEPIF